MFYKGLYRENIHNIFLSETTTPRALIFRMWYHLMDPTKVEHIMPPGLTSFTYAYIDII